MERAPQDSRPFAGQVADTLQTALDVLRQLEASLLQAGFAEGSSAYREMSRVLLAQRLWAVEAGVDAVLDPRFAAIGARARAVHDLLAPYTDAMLRLSAITELAPTLAADEPGPADAVLRALREGGGRMSASALKAQLGLDSADLQRLLVEMCATGAIKHRRASGRDIYTLD